MLDLSCSIDKRYFDDDDDDDDDDESQNYLIFQSIFKYFSNF